LGTEINLPWSNFISGIKATPENKVGIPMTRPENVDPPPRCSAYRLDDETMIKNEICCFQFNACNLRNVYPGRTWSRVLVKSTIVNELFFGSLNSSFRRISGSADIGSGILGCREEIWEGPLHFMRSKTVDLILPAMVVRFQFPPDDEIFCEAAEELSRH
jgi:hypothetical protein